MGLTNENVGPKILAKIKIYVLTRAELLFKVCYEIPCKTHIAPVLNTPLYYSIGMTPKVPKSLLYTGQYYLKIRTHLLCCDVYNNSLPIRLEFFSLPSTHLFWSLCSEKQHLDKTGFFFLSLFLVVKRNSIFFYVGNVVCGTVIPIFGQPYNTSQRIPNIVP